MQITFTNEQAKAFATQCATHGTRVINRFFDYRAAGDSVKAAEAFESVDQLQAVRNMGRTTGLLNADQIQVLSDRIAALVG